MNLVNKIIICTTTSCKPKKSTTRVIGDYDDCWMLCKNSENLEEETRPNQNDSNDN